MNPCFAPGNTISNRSGNTKAFFFETRNPSEPECRLPAQPTWPSLIALGRDFIADPIELEVIRLEKPYKRLTDFLLTGAGGGELSVSQRVRDAVQEVEPGVHQFLPIELQQPDGSIFPVAYWGLNIRHHVDCYSWGRHTFLPKEDRALPDPHRDAPILGVRFPRDPADLILERAAVEGLHLWRERRASRGVFVSDTMIAAFKRHRLNAYSVGEVTLA